MASLQQRLSFPRQRNLKTFQIYRKGGKVEMDPWVIHEKPVQKRNFPKGNKNGCVHSQLLRFLDPLVLSTFIHRKKTKWTDALSGKRKDKTFKDYLGFHLIVVNIIQTVCSIEV